jgi:phosphoglycolate phosphatase
MIVSDTAVLFDLDGVLVDSRVAITGCINAALVEHDLPSHSRDSLERFIGPPLASAFAELTGSGPDSRLVASCVATYRRHYVTASVRDTVAVAGITAAITDLARRWPLAIATSKALAFAEPVLEAVQLRRPFAAVCGPGLSVQGETKAETIASALAALGSPARAVMVGDRSFDVVGAHTCGIPAIGVTWGIGDRAELQSAGADVVIDAPGQLTAAVNQLMPQSAVQANRPAN